MVCTQDYNCVLRKLNQHFWCSQHDVLGTVKRPVCKLLCILFDLVGHTFNVLKPQENDKLNIS